MRQIVLLVEGWQPAQKNKLFVMKRLFSWMKIVKLKRKEFSRWRKIVNKKKLLLKHREKEKNKNGKRRIKLMRYRLKGRERRTYTKEDK